MTSSAVFTAAKPLQKILLEKRPKGRGIRPIAHYVRNKIGKIQELIVTSKQRGKGIGTRLIKQMLDFFRNRNCVISEIGVFVKNLPAIQVYGNAGFKKREYKMQLRLNETQKFRPFC